MQFALAQIDPTVGDISVNLKMILNAATQAVQRGADILITPELAICGYPPEDLVLRPAFVAKCEEAVRELAEVAPLPILVGGPYADSRGVFNSAYLLQDGTVKARYDKMALPNYSVFDERRTFQVGDGPLVVEVAGVRIGVTICEDIWIENGPAHASVQAGAEVVVNLSASPYHLAKGLIRENLVVTFARKTGCAVVYANLVGGQDELAFDGCSLVVSANGTLIARGAYCDEDLIVSGLTDGSGAIAPLPADQSAELWAALTLGLRDYVEKNGFNGVLLGVSGGIDSALVAALSVAALGPERVHGVSMPTRFNVAETRSDAQVVAENLGIDFRELPIEDLRLSFHELLPELEGLAAENLQARIRGVLLMALSNQHGWLVLTTGNKSEVATGYSTLYGDSVGGFAPIKDVPKTLVHALSRHVNAVAGREVIPVSTIERPPTAELRDDQRDDQSLPPYDVLDPVLHAYIEDRLSPAEIAAAGLVDLATATRIAGLVDRAEYKRRQSAPGLKVHPIAFGRDRRMPITNRFS